MLNIVTAESIIGKIPGIAAETMFFSRRAVCDARIHRALQSGIVGTRRTGAESIVVSGGYEDDEDHGEVIIYTGHGGNDPATRRQIADQSFEAPGNAALVTSGLNGAPVRVVRGRNRDSRYAPSNGYRYDGLYRVESWWREPGRSGYAVCRYRLVTAERELAALATAFSAPKTPPAGVPAPQRSAMTVQRIIRSGTIAEFVKDLHDHVCQFCGTRLAIRDRGYSEAAHIRPLGRPHDGPDDPSNVLCLCPNCHVLFDHGVLTVSSDLTVLGGGRMPRPMRMDINHKVDHAYLAYHRDYFGCA